MIKTDKNGFPLDFTDWPELEKMHKITPVMRLVPKILGILHKLNYCEFNGVRPKVVQAKMAEADIYKELDIFKDLDVKKYEEELARFEKARND